MDILSKDQALSYSDFRSDTVTHPTQKMRRAMAEAEVGDDVFGDDPTVLKLEYLAAQMMGKEAGLFIPSGTMGNAVAVKAWTTELDEVIVEAKSHIYNMESTQITLISRVMPRPVMSKRGAMDPIEVEDNIRRPTVSNPRTSLICVENTHNNWGGVVIPLSNLQALRKVADRHGVRIHMDGARIFNASIASGIPVKEYAAVVDSLMFCLSKGLSAPVGSLLVGPKNFIDYARRLRKALGGGMRQVGVLAAPGMIALTEMVERLKEDHIKARELSFAIANLPGIELNPHEVETNIIIFGFNHPEISSVEFLSELKKEGILALAVKGGIRLVTHKDITDSDVQKTIAAFHKILTV